MRRISGSSPVPPHLFRHGGGSAPSNRALDFSTSLNPLGPPASVLAALRPAVAGGDAIARYPDADSTALREHLAALHGVSPRQVVVGNGSSELIQAIPAAWRPRRVAIVEPTYTEYLRASLLAGAAVEHWLAEDETFSLEPFEPGGADLVWLCNPNNPTGRLWPRARLRPWIATHPRTLFVLDESFLPFRPDEAEHSLVGGIEMLGNLVVVCSLTKLYTLPGLRLGYAIAGLEQAERLRAQLVPWSVNALAQVAGLVALRGTPFLSETHAWFLSESSYMAEALECLKGNLDVIPSQANFFLLRLGEAISTCPTATLSSHGILVRDASNFIGLDARYIRVGLRSREHNRLLVGRLHQCLLPERGLEDEWGESLR
jgi:threonine-phosphate decarboxylase